MVSKISRVYVDFEANEETIQFLSPSSREENIVIIPCGGGGGDRKNRISVSNDISCSCSSSEEKSQNDSIVKGDDFSEKFACRSYWGIMLSLASGLASTFSGIIVKCLKGFHPFTLTTFRCQGIMVPTFLMILYYKFVKRKPIFQAVWPLSDKGKRKKFGFVIVRAIVGFIASFLNFYALKLIPLADTRVIGSAKPVFVIFAARIFLGEPIGIFPVCAAMMTTVGVGIIARPPILTGEENFEIDALMGTLYATLAMFSTTLSNVVLRYLKGVHVSVITLAYGFWGTILSIICASLVANHLDIPQTTNEWLLMAGLTITAFCSQTAITLAMKYENAGTVVIVRTLDTVMSFLLQYLILGVVPDKYSILGAILIVLCVSLITLRKWISSLPEKHSMRQRCWIVLK